MRRIVITGATGMIALALVRFILKCERDVEIYCVSRPDSPRIANIAENASVHLITCDQNEYDRLPSLIPFPCDVFYHFAWEGTVGSSRNDALLQMNNISCTMSAVSNAKALGCHCFIGAGSQAEYGSSASILKPETPVRPETGYGMAKLAAGQLSRLLCHNLGMRHIWTRILSVYGPFDGESTMVMSCIRALLKHEKMSLTKGEQIWDYLHCDDAARALYLLAEKGIDGAVYPLGSGIGRPLSEYIYKIRDILSPSLQPGLGDLPYAEKQVMHLCADISTLTRDTGFAPEISFDDGIRMTVDWIVQKKLS